MERINKSSEELDLIKKIFSTFSEIKKNANHVKCVVVGDGAVGKTNLILSYLENKFVDQHVPTASDIYNCKSKF